MASGGLAAMLAAGGGVAAAQPLEDSLVGTTCSYPQILAALQAQSPDLAGQLTASPAATSWLRGLLAALPDERRSMVAQAKSIPGARQYYPVISQVVNTCSGF